MELGSKLRPENQQEIERAQKRYHEILGGEIEASELEELRRLLIVLDKNSADVQRDHQTVKQIDAAKRTIHDHRRAAGDFESAHQALKDFDAETDRIVLQRAQDRAPLTAKVEKLNRMESDARQAVQEVNRLRQENPVLLADELEAKPF